MIRVLLLFLVVCFGPFLSLIGRGNSSRHGIVNIGAILAFNTTIGRVAKVAIDAAVKDVNSDTSVLRSTELVIHAQDSNCNALTGIMGGLRLLETDVVAIVGPQSSTVAHVVAHLANEVQVPLVSFAATDPSLSSAQYPFFVRATQSDAFQMAAIAELVEYFQWREVIVIFTDDEYGRNGVADLNGRLAEKGCKISYKATLPSEANGTDIFDVLIKVAIMGSRVFILHADHDSGRKVFSVAHSLSMTTTGYAWIATDWLSSLLDSITTLGSEVINTMQGVLTLRQHTAKQQREKISSLDWRNLSKDDRYLQLNSYGLYAYDSVWMIAYALDAFFDDGGSIKFSNDSSLQEIGGGGSLSIEALRMFVDGNLLLKKIHSTVFDGVTGHVQFDVDGFLVHPAYDILNVVGTGTRRIGYWSNYSGLSIESPESLYLKPPNRSSLNQMLSDVIWRDKHR
ncbi:hypothetical protein HPP92_022225 [Vanilla planifolia]|uniref:Receptor ligand binding region domain-containing protein n=1 Tax=Vanilla planifolia TaxID=51239 RepID=A0A835UEX0_VANPL|nr:hypothetical protein HPP92_022225 [Vanilla planifolia]